MGSMTLICPACGSSDVLPGYPDTAACCKCAHQWKRECPVNAPESLSLPPLTFTAGADWTISATRSVQVASETTNLGSEPAWIGPEKELMNQCRKAWQAAGRRVFRVGQFIAKGAGTDIACPDAFVRVPELGRAVYVGVELKTIRGRLSPEQADAEARGDIIVVRNVSQALRAVEAPE